MNDQMNNEKSDASIGVRSGRRQFLGKAALAVAGIAAAELLSPSTAWAVTPALKFSDIPGTGDVKVLNYALALEDLEADLYSQVLMRLTTGGTNGLGKTIKGLNLSPNSPDVRYVKEFGKVEKEHRDFLRTAITSVGGPTIKPFKYDFGLESKSRKDADDLIYTAEKTGVTAYLGAIPLLGSVTYLQIAGSIQGTEARHTAVVAAMLNGLFNEGLSVAPLANDNGGRDQTATPDAVLASVSGFIVV